MLNRFNGQVLPFASNATGTNRTVFGDLLQSDNIDDNINAAFLLGWEIVGINDNPTKQDFNALAYTVSNLVSYLYQQGIPSWNINQKYYIDGYCVGSDGIIYKSLTGTLLTPNIGNDPVSDLVNWKNPLIDYALLNGSDLEVFRVADAVDNNDAINKAQFDDAIAALINIIPTQTALTGKLFFYGGF